MAATDNIGDAASAAFPVAGAIQAGAGIISGVVGLINAGKAKREAAELARTRPKYNISPYAGQEVSLTESELGNGLGADATRAYEEGSDRDLSNSLGALLKSGGSSNNIGSLYDSSAQGKLQLAKLREATRSAKITNVLSSWRNMNEQEDKAFEFNKWMPWADAAKANGEARQSAENETWSGFGTAAAGGMNAAEQVHSDNQFNNYFKTVGGGNPMPSFTGVSGSAYSNTPIPVSNTTVANNNVLMQDSYPRIPMTSATNLESTYSDNLGDSWRR